MALGFGFTKLQKKKRKKKLNSNVFRKNSWHKHKPCCELFHGGTIVFLRHHAEGNVQLLAY